MTFSDWFDILVAHAEIMGYTVNRYDFTLPNDIAGCCYYPHEGSTISINIREADYALMTLAHEIGHALDYKRTRGMQSNNVDVREAKAYLLGWGILKATRCPMITKAMWRDWHPYIIVQPSVKSLFSQKGIDPDIRYVYK